MTAKIFCGVDAGGTTFKCAAADQSGGILGRLRVETGVDPQRTVAECVSFFVSQAQQHSAAIAGVGLAAFGPLDLDPQSAHYGGLLKTPKPGWSMFPMRRAFANALQAPTAIDTDVNAALLAEMKYGAAKDAETVVYFTIGTGIGAAIFARKGLLGRPFHPEFGHIAVKRHAADNCFASVCPFHDDCLEGFASATALTARFGDIESLNDDHFCWDLSADYLAQACRAAFLAVRPQRIILGGGVLLREGLLERVRQAWTNSMGGYLGFSAEDAERIAVRAGLGDDAGLIGALALAFGEVPGCV